MITFSVNLDTRKLDKLMGDARPRAEQILDRAAAQVQRNATVRTTRVDIGTMKAGWRWVATAPLKRVIYNTQEYALYHEMGTYKMAAEPVLRPSVDQVRPILLAAWKQLCDCL